jgi:hypothetical protein
MCDCNCVIFFYFKNLSVHCIIVKGLKLTDILEEYQKEKHQKSYEFDSKQTKRK